MGEKVGFAGELGVPWVFMAARESSLGELRLPRPGNRDLPPKIPTTIPGNCVWQCRSPGLIWPWDFDGVCGDTLCLQARSLQQKPPHSRRPHFYWIMSYATNASLTIIIAHPVVQSHHLSQLPHAQLDLHETSSAVPFTPSQ